MNEKYTEKAHGRVNLIGEHTDYNGGWVLPTAIPQYTEVTLLKREDNLVSIRSFSQHKKHSARDNSFQLGHEKQTKTWTDYFQGATKILSEVAASKGQAIKGFEASVTSSMPEGGGLSSSAALEISFLKAIRSAYKLNVTDVELALIGQRVENEFVGARVGIMDQMACSLAKSGEALFLDTLKMTYENIKIPLDKMDLLIINSGISHRLSAEGGGYNERRAQCEEACALLKINLLRDISAEELEKKKNVLSDLLYRRARHVVTENERVHKAVAAIRSGDLPELGRLFVSSHAPMRDDYQVSLPEIDLLVDLCLKDKDVFGARLTGGGFGGSIVVITKKGEASRIANSVLPQYHNLTKETATVLA